MITQISTEEYFPAQIFRDKNGPCTILTAAIAPAVGANNNVVTGITGVRVRVVSMLFQSNAAGISVLTWKSANATNIGWTTAPTNASASPQIILPFNPAGWIETITSEALTVDVATSQALIMIRYINYTP